MKVYQQSLPNHVLILMKTKSRAVFLLHFKEILSCCKEFKGALNIIFLSWINLLHKIGKMSVEKQQNENVFVLARYKQILMFWWQKISNAGWV